MAEVLGVLSKPDALVRALEQLKAAGFDDLDAYSPVPSHEIEEAIGRGPSWVRLWTLVGGLTGVTLGYLFTIWTAYDWPIMIGGKPFASIPAYTVIAFELTILFGGLATLLGLLVVGKLPYGSFGKQDKGYSPRFSAEEFGVVVECAERDVAEVDALLRSHHALEVNLVEA